ncbi:protein CHROMATIN REMODELING 35 isoform X2 [Diospyros lotus]|nr:protein CHROMATIN REMODELING 35 isoform X2 [Diospyros lotus]
MNSAMEGWSNTYPSPIAAKASRYSSNDWFYNGRKRMRTLGEEKLHDNKGSSAHMSIGSARKKSRGASHVIDYSDPFSVSNLLGDVESGKFGSVTKDMKDLIAQRTQLLNSFFAMNPTLTNVEWRMGAEVSQVNHVEWRMGAEVSKVNQPVTSLAQEDVIDLDDDSVVNDVPANLPIVPVVVIDSDDEVIGDQRSCNPYQEIVLRKPDREFLMKDFFNMEDAKSRSLKKDKVRLTSENEASKDKASENETSRDKGVYLGVKDDMEIEEGQQTGSDNEGLDDIWKEMTVALECSKDTAEDPLPYEQVRDDQDECDHSFVLKDDLGYVCRICGVIQRSIETIIEYQYAKVTRNARTYSYESRTVKDKEATEMFRDGSKLSGHDFVVDNICAHPRHRKQMKPHQVEGFNFLLSNLVAESPGGCIMAHAPGSGKTFMIISFMQSFLAKFPYARPLVVLPRGILATWKKEFKRWQVEDIPLLDFYSVKADNRSQQLEVLNQWAGQRSILFLGYKQFSSIVCDSENSIAAIACQEILLELPSILILDEGHTPRNENTDVLNSLKKVQTPRKVVLSGTLYQNHVKEVFNIFDLVRPKFLRLDTSRSIIRRILSRVPSVRKHVKAKGLENVFYESVERTLQKDENFKRKITVIQDLREMTSKVLHFYKGDFLDELPGLVDFTVFLSLSPKQRREVEELKKLGRKFKISSVGSALYIHPHLRYSLKDSSTGLDDAQMDQILEKVELREGVKAKFFFNLLALCESGGEKLLVFSQYLQPLKFLERLAVKMKGWSLGKEIFVITGDSSSENRELSMDRFNTSPEARVFFGSIKACGEGISLVGASRVIIIDVHLNPSVTRQAIGRAFRPGQEKKVYIYRLVAADSPEEEDHWTCFKKESIAKMWFEWNQYCGQNEFEMETVSVSECGDQFLESPRLSEDVKALYKR